MLATNKDSFRFRSRDRIGRIAAEEDNQFLTDCFIYTGDYTTLKDFSDPRRLVLGRTGAGKTALLEMLGQSEDKVISIKPESLALNYITNSSVIQFFGELGFDMTPFYRLLWRHVFTVEILKNHHNIDSEWAQNHFLTEFIERMKGATHKKSIDYLKRWGGRFWEDTESRIKEITVSFEGELKNSIKAEIKPVNIDASSAVKLKEEAKKEIVHRAKHVISESHAAQLSEVLSMLRDLITDKQKRYYVVIDKLDENWVQDSQRYLLIRALIETMRDFRVVPQVKIIVALRYDLVENVFSQTRDSGFQEEKYQDMFLDLRWSEERLREMLDKRVNKLIQSRYSGSQKVTYRDVLPKMVGNTSGVSYLIDRTLMRPRDLIDFFNRCIEGADGKVNINAETLKRAEAEYSHNRLRALSYEWNSIYPNIEHASDFLRQRSSSFFVNELTDDECSEFCLSAAVDKFAYKDSFSDMAERAINGNEIFAFKQNYLAIMYKVGIVGVQLDSYQKPMWSTGTRRTIRPNEIKENTRVSIHPCFWQVLIIRKEK